jgi:hypothetical protein
MGKMRNAYKILVGKPEGERPQGGHRHRWKENIRWVLVNTVINLRVS